jgi:hypothetical protein
MGLEVVSELLQSYLEGEHIAYPGYPGIGSAKIYSNLQRMDSVGHTVFAD